MLTRTAGTLRNSGVHARSLQILHPIQNQLNRHLPYTNNFIATQRNTRGGRTGLELKTEHPGAAEGLELKVWTEPNNRQLTRVNYADMNNNTTMLTDCIIDYKEEINCGHENIVKYKLGQSLAKLMTNFYLFGLGCIVV